MNKNENLKRYLKSIVKWTFLQSFFIIFFMSYAVAMTTNGQEILDKKVTLSVKNEGLKATLQKIEKAADVKFTYTSSTISLPQQVSLYAQGERLGDLLKKLLSPFAISYEAVGNKIILQRQKTTFTTIAVTLPAKTITGTVRNEKGEPVDGASVTVKGKTIGTVTTEGGHFTVNAEDGDVLVISGVGYITQEIKVAVNNNIDVVLVATENKMDEVVVVGYGTQRKSNITGAVSTVNMNRINDIPVANLSNALPGRAPGVTVINTSGLAGASSSIRIRGSFGDPLYVIDGILRDKAAFDALDPNEIDQMSVLKDAATSSIYGSQAGNGVIVITTKKGSNQKPVFSLQTSYTTTSPTQKLLSDLTTPTDELIYQNRVAQFSGNPLPNGDREFNYFKDKNYNVNDWIWRKPTTQKYLLSVNGGNEKISYFNLISYTGENGSYKNLDYGKFNLRSNVTAKLSDAISMNLNIAAAQQNHDRFYWPFMNDDDYNVGDLYRVTFNWPKLFPFYLEKDGTPANRITDYPVQTPMGSWTAWNVIDQVLGDRYIKTRKRQLTSILTMDVKLDKILKGLSTKFVTNYEANDFLRKWYLTFQKNYTFLPADPSGNRFIPAAPNPERTNTFTFSQSLPFLQYNMRNGWKYQLDWYLNYSQKFNRHAVDAMIVWEQGENKFYDATAKGSSPLTPIDQMFAYSTDQANRYGTGYESIGARQSWIGRLNYNFDNKYLADFSFRYDGNTLFAKDKRWGFFPSASLAWRISQESFFKQNVSWINDLKLRASYGTTGNVLDVNNDPIPAFSYTYFYRNSGSYIFGDNLYTTIAPGSTPNPNITWATVNSTNLGLDFSIFNYRLSGKFEVFKNVMRNILGSRTVILPDTYGQSLAPENYAQRSFRGYEISLDWKDRFAKDFTYSIYGNLGFAKDRWDVLDQGSQYKAGGSLEWLSIIGQPADRLIGLKAVGIVRTQAELDKLISSGFKQYGRTPYLGAIIYEDVRGDSYKLGADGRVDGNDIQLLSNNGKPRINYGFGFNVGWKGIIVDAHFQGVGAYDRMIGNLEGGGIRQWGGNFRTYYPIWAGDVWTPENPNAKYPRVIGENWAEAGTGASSFWIRNGSYLRLRNLNIAYNLPQKWVSFVKLKDVQVFGNATNVFTISKMTEFQDPEQDNYDSYPVMKTFTIGLNVKF